MTMRKLLAVILILLSCASGVSAATRLRLATTTSTENSGLLKVLLPPFEKRTGIKVDVIAVGTGKALTLARRCDVDLVMVHAPKLEKQFVAQGYGIERRRFMHNYFAIVGPPNDPALVGQARDLTDAMRRIADKQAPFLSRGDRSGTHVKELSLWAAAGIKPHWPDYREVGQGMGAVLTMAGQMGAYTLTDLGTFYKYRSKGKLALKVLFAKGELLENPYSVIVVNPQRCPRVKLQAARALADWVCSPEGQRIIAQYRAGGHQLFWPDLLR